MKSKIVNIHDLHLGIGTTNVSTILSSNSVKITLLNKTYVHNIKSIYKFNKYSFTDQYINLPLFNYLDKANDTVITSGKDSEGNLYLKTTLSEFYSSIKTELAEFTPELPQDTEATKIVNAANDMFNVIVNKSNKTVTFGSNYTLYDIMSNDNLIAKIYITQIIYDTNNSVSFYFKIDYMSNTTLENKKFKFGDFTLDFTNGDEYVLNYSYLDYSNQTLVMYVEKETNGEIRYNYLKITLTDIFVSNSTTSNNIQWTPLFSGQEDETWWNNSNCNHIDIKLQATKDNESVTDIIYLYPTSSSRPSSLSLIEASQPANMKFSLPSFNYLINYLVFRYVLELNNSLAFTLKADLMLSVVKLTDLINFSSIEILPTYNTHAAETESDIDYISKFIKYALTSKDIYSGDLDVAIVKYKTIYNSTVNLKLTDTVSVDVTQYTPVPVKLTKFLNIFRRNIDSNIKSLFYKFLVSKQSKVGDANRVLLHFAKGAEYSGIAFGSIDLFYGIDLS